MNVLPNMRELDLDAMHAPKFLEYANIGVAHPEDGEFRIGMEYSSRKSVVAAIRSYTISRGVDYDVYESESQTFYAKYKMYRRGCDWLIQAKQSLLLIEVEELSPTCRQSLTRPSRVAAEYWKLVELCHAYSNTTPVCCQGAACALRHHASVVLLGADTLLQHNDTAPRVLTVTSTYRQNTPLPNIRPKHQYTLHKKIISGII
ncbi:hypothetical protein Ahy_A10g047593 [Arachis hypogaea]|uniref:Transposase MuDR plant domain-containing protein n=1 Tax=Arachis hypogaea TaxID=3818 RepID=A0A445B2Y6_ARAHY|nr:hypothetical protein Ahy_A10g047593 [Arachis hypogaea]